MANSYLKGYSAFLSNLGEKVEFFVFLFGKNVKSVIKANTKEFFLGFDENNQKIGESQLSEGVKK